MTATITCTCPSTRRCVLCEPAMFPNAGLAVSRRRRFDPSSVFVSEEEITRAIWQGAYTSTPDRERIRWNIAFGKWLGTRQ